MFAIGYKFSRQVKVREVRLSFPIWAIGLLLSLSWLQLEHQALAEEISREHLIFFENKVRPLLVSKCIECHGQEKEESGLRLDSREAILEGGESGDDIVPHKPDESLLIEAIRYESYEMPPNEQLKDEQIEVLTRWIKMGAPWPEAMTLRPAKQEFTQEERGWWAFRELRSPKAPHLEDDNWSQNAIDRFLLRKMRAKGITPSPPASRRDLIRRVYYDMIGVPPTPEQVDVFLADNSPEAYEKIVDSLLESPHFGERWARHWLDVVRYAESDGFLKDHYRPNAWRYRDYVIRSFNQDKPYDQFVREQIAGDEVAPDDPDSLIATGFLRLGIHDYNQRDVRTQWDDYLNDITNVTGEAFMGVSIGCARCHDHKFDPIRQEDYYRLRAYFAALLPQDNVEIATPKSRAIYNEQYAIWEAKTSKIRNQIADIEAPYFGDKAEKYIASFPDDVRRFMYKPDYTRTSLEKQLAGLVDRQVVFEQKTNIKYKKKHEQQLTKLRAELKKLDSLKPAPLPTVRAVVDVGSQAPAMTIPGRSDPNNILPGILSLYSEEPAEIEFVSYVPDSTGRRTALADWLTNKDNALATRLEL